MKEYGKITHLGMDADKGADIRVHISHQAAVMIKEKNIRDAWLILDDGRTISAAQRKKIYTTLRDISNYTGYLPEEAKEQMKYYHMQLRDCDYFSLSDCSVDQARDFINTLIEFCLRYSIPTLDPLLGRTDDIGMYLKQCLVHSVCAVCGAKGEIHHWDAIGMGNDRRVYDDTENRKVCLCRLHHTIAHQKGRIGFEETYHVYGIVWNGEDDYGAYA